MTLRQIRNGGLSWWRSGVLRLALLMCAILTGSPSGYAQEGGRSKEVQVSFGKLTVESRGEDGNPLESKVYIYEQESGNWIGGEKWTDRDSGATSFNLKPGIYKVRVNMDNGLEQERVEIVAEKETSVGFDFGKLLFVYNEDVKAYLYDQASGNRVVGEKWTGKEGRISYYLAPGTYKVLSYHDKERKEYPDGKVVANKVMDSKSIFFAQKSLG